MVCFFFSCLGQQSFQQLEIPKKDYLTTKRLPFVANTCDRMTIFSNNLLERTIWIQIWENGEYRIAFLNDEPFDAIEDLKIYQSHDYLWTLSFVPLFAGYYCNQYHLTGYLLYFDADSKQKLKTKLEEEKKKTNPNLPIMAFREYSLMDERILSQKKEELKKIYKEREYYKYINPLSKPKIWDPKSKSDLTFISNDQLIDYCLEFPYECVTDSNYLSEIQFRKNPREKQKTNASPSDFSSSLLTKIQKTTDKINFGCYCRKIPDLSIYSSCPIDQFGLDSVCKNKNDCLEKTNVENQKLCHNKFKEELSILMKTKESKDTIHHGQDNFERMIFYTKKLWALEMLEGQKE
ncbi:hypothetical protein EHR01_07640 [Leptospira mtsangambouensis]|uniref:Lipoprotein n=2 Tax=Leptospira mtsangambouensis TaxID=2484912 RepID=A0ABY2P199_9LEPT|nr:hypothetical protein EHR01_07640 [Leptospira mtsangambouensis]